MNVLRAEKRAAVLSHLVEGCSLRSIVRLTGVSMTTTLRLLTLAGDACATYIRDTIYNVPAERIQCDEIWQYVYAKAKNVPGHLQGMFGVGDTWTWVAIDADSKLVISWLLGERTAESANYFMADVAKRLVNRIQLTTDGFQPYRWAVGMAFHGEVDFAQLVKTYGREEHGAGRYSPPICTGATPKVIRGNPDPAHISTSFSERQNLSMRMHMRRFTRLKRIQQEGRESGGRDCSVLLLVQLHSRSPVDPRNPGDASRYRKPRSLVRGRATADRLTIAA